MTIIAAVHEPGVGSWIASDTLAVRDGVRHDMRTLKWVVYGSRALGVSGSQALTSLVDRHKETLLALGKHPFDVIWDLRRLMQEHGAKPKDEEGRLPWMETWVIYATPLGVWGFGTDGAVASLPAGEMMADGSGHQFAFGAWEATAGQPASDRLAAAVLAAMKRDQYCGGKLKIQCLREELP